MIEIFPFTSQFAFALECRSKEKTFLKSDLRFKGFIEMTQSHEHFVNYSAFRFGRFVEVRKYYLAIIDGITVYGRSRRLDASIARRRPRHLARILMTTKNITLLTASPPRTLALNFPLHNLFLTYNSFWLNCHSDQPTRRNFARYLRVHDKFRAPSPKSFGGKTRMSFVIFNLLSV